MRFGLVLATAVVGAMIAGAASQAVGGFTEGQATWYDSILQASRKSNVAGAGTALGGPRAASLAGVGEGPFIDRQR